MNHKSKFGFVLISLLVLASVYLLRPKDSKDREDAKAEAPKTELAAAPLRSSSEDRGKAVQAAQKPQKPTQEDMIPFETEQEFLDSLRTANFLGLTDITLIVEKLKVSNEAFMAGVLIDNFKNADKSSAARGRLIFVADHWRSQKLLPLWKDLVLRETKLYETEKEAIFAEEGTLAGREIQLEMMTGIGNLGLLAADDKEALGLLKSIVLQPDPGIHSDFIRERAFYALQEANVATANSVVRRLASNDTLLDRITRIHD